MDVIIGDTHCEVTVQHLEYGSVIGGRQIDPYSILKIGECGRSASFKLMKRVLQPGEDFPIMCFMKWQQIEFFQEFYSKRIERSQPLSYIDFVNRKMKQYHSFLPIGNSSHRLEDVVVEFDTEIPLIVMSSLVVNVDPVTRRPSSFPQSFQKHFTKEGYKNKVKRMQPSCQKLFESVPKYGLFSRDCVISVSQIDRNYHVNQAVYAKLCYDCIGDAFANSFFGNTGSILDRFIHRMSFLYLDEISFGDKVTTTVWQDERNDLIYKFHVKRGSVLAHQAEIQLYPQNHAIKSHL